MANTVRVTIEGMDEVLKGLRKAEDLAKVAVNEALKKGANIIAYEAKARVHRRTGRLAISISVDEPKEKPSPWKPAVVVGPGKKEFYGLFLELGTSKMPAYPFLVPAMKASKQKVEAVVAAELRRRLGV